MPSRSAICALCLSTLGATIPGLAETPPPVGLCNEYPEYQPAIYATVLNQTGRQFADRVSRDPELAALLGNPVVRAASDDPSSFAAYHVYFTYPPLEDPEVNAYRLRNLGINQFGAVATFTWTTCFSAPPADQMAKFVEFYHPGLDHYFYTGDAGEIAAVDARAVGPWVRTGKSFDAVTTIGCWQGRTERSVYRFYGTPGKGPDSHFFTRDRAECYAIDRSGQWSLEGVPFYANAVGPDGTCSGGRGTALYRTWRPFGDSNHRFTTDRAVVDEMRGKGWIDEGTVMCLTGR